MKKRPLVFSICLCVIALGLFTSCGKTNAEEQPAVIENTEKNNIQRPIHYGRGGVYYFACKGKDLSASLAVLLSTDSSMKYVGYIPDVDDNGRHNGFTVIMEKK
ncbi:MAG: hypothetical protein KBC17_01640 [Candidatus Pacebacteria bacterium]|nr:hypothetical protein [Candidatus Paceibacterota bacterium]